MNYGKKDMMNGPVSKKRGLRKRYRRLLIFVAIVFLLMLPCSRVNVAAANISNESQIKEEIEKLEKEKLYYQEKIKQINEKIKLLQRKLGYGKFSLLLVERYKRSNLSEVFLGGGLLDNFFSEHPVAKSMEIVLVMVKVTNDGEKYIRQINASAVDNKGEEYSGEGYIRNDDMVIVDRYESGGKLKTRVYKKGERISKIKGELECKCKNIFYTEWVGIINTLKSGQIRIFPVEEETEGIMRPGDCYEWVFIFVIPENRSIKNFILNCGIAATPTGFPEIYKITIPSQKFN
ncbi:hypothetical protein DRJ04_10120 [Candidatus Aerophobetes bacterium]|uniref:Uncharacterized protein n=1 Tax=Aerophobetes bacterium TaxID=2030807 RepID=A0A662D2S2_UNCAE|nr:MAG: hypothetical protein DRJ04_10120 [Candidatus Aerophobetes bacterium]